MYGIDYLNRASTADFASFIAFLNSVRFCVASPEELVVMERLGRLRQHLDDGAFDTAMQGVIDRLDPQQPTLH